MVFTARDSTPLEGTSYTMSDQEFLNVTGSNLVGWLIAGHYLTGLLYNVVGTAFFFIVACACIRAEREAYKEKSK